MQSIGSLESRAPPGPVRLERDPSEHRFPWYSATEDSIYEQALPPFRDCLSHPLHCLHSKRQWWTAVPSSSAMAAVVELCICSHLMRTGTGHMALSSFGDSICSYEHGALK